MQKLLVVLVVVMIAGGAVCAATEIPASEWVGASGVRHADGAMSLQIPKRNADVGDLMASLKTPLKLDPGVYTVSAAVRAEPGKK